ncbi:MAG: NADP-dependent 3-hydroxy acid dehydrogenase YdfG [Sodalis sp.]|nr:MAG: NADP-dependent 3-hydroxy acid dehydrogenase YdfG [Sodalis sp.]
MILSVTGATAGFGKAITRLFIIKQGHKVIGTGLRHALRNCIRRLGVTFSRCAWMCATGPLSPNRLVSLPVEWREVDVLLNNAGRR